MSERPLTSEKSRAFAALSTIWKDRGIEASVTLGAQATLEGSDRRLASDGAASLLGLERESWLFEDPLTVGALLGSGGMGEVRRAVQHSLRREVAIKQTSREAGLAAETALLKEAWVGAHVEHPNVVPVHALVSTGQVAEHAGLVMKRIAGRPWSDLLIPPASASAQAFDRYLEEQLDVFVRVCRAVAFAHSRGVLHLDLKPDNVMVGEHGEVYVLDWGLSAGFGEAAPHWLGRAADIHRVAGTPGYMAPELVAADASAIGVATDVYLLGAVLHHVITGEPLHRGESLAEVLGAAFLSEPPAYANEVSPELAGIVCRATSFAPSSRYAGVAELRESVEDFLRHRPADRLVRSVRASLADVQASLATAHTDDARLEPALAECEIGLEEARRVFSAHPSLPELERAITLARIEHASRSVSATKARRLLERIRSGTSEMHPEIDASLAALEDRLTARERQVRALEELARELDLSIGTVSRARIWLVLGTLWAVISFLYAALSWNDPAAVSYPSLLAQGATMLVLALPLAWFGRKAILGNRVNRRISGALVLCGVTVQLLWTAAMLLDLPVQTALALTTTLYFFAFLTLAAAIDRRLLAASAAFGLATLCSAFLPRLVHVWLGIAGGLAAVSMTRLKASAGPRDEGRGRPAS